MASALLDEITRKLLEKFGRGSHKPGSGSAAALNGLLAAMLIRTVIGLTRKKESYIEWHEELLALDLEIDTRIYPELERLFQEDSNQFDKVINLRRSVQEESDPKRKAAIKSELLRETIPATEIPIQIAELCKELADMAVVVCDHGWKAVRGDSSVALNNAVAAIGGCLSIVELNLLQFPFNAWVEKQIDECSELREAHEKLTIEIKKKEEALRMEVEDHLKIEREKVFKQEVQFFCSEPGNGKKLSYEEIEAIARRLQNMLLTHRHAIWEEETPEFLVDLLKPQVVLKKILGYRVEHFDDLGDYDFEGGRAMTAGLIDKSRKIVMISDKFDFLTQNFTVAHELGHALLHGEIVQHRDRGLNGSVLPKDRLEREADKFAAFFLMPRKQVEKLFEENFGTRCFVINNETAFFLGEKSVNEFKIKCKDRHGLAMHLASLDHYQVNSFYSMADVFGVSVNAMAFRLEELGLVEF